MSLDVLSLVLSPLGAWPLAAARSAEDDASHAPGPFLEGRHVDRRGLRDYRLYVPLSHAACTGRDANDARPAPALSPLPMVVMLHGCLQTADDFARGTRMNEAAEAMGFLVLYPAQCPRANPTRCWNWFSPGERRRDAGETGLLGGLVRDVMARYPVDPERVYVAGLSAGGAMAAVLGEAYPDLFAAVGVHSGPVPGAATDLSSALATMRDGPAQSPDVPLSADVSAAAAMPPLIVFHGDLDDTVHPSNGLRLAGDDLANPCGAGGCGATRVAGHPRVGVSARAYTRRARRDARGRVQIEHWTVHGSGHAWSGGSAAGSYTDPAGPSATDAMLRFFFSHTLRGPTVEAVAAGADGPVGRAALLRLPKRAARPAGARAGRQKKPGTGSPSIFARAKT